MTPDLDLVLFGATGYTGKLVAEYLAGAATREPLRWAIAGRSRDKLESLRKSLAPAAVDMIVVDVLDGAAVGAIARRTRAVCTTAGPFAKYGSALLGACAEAGTHYCDLTGEVQWVRRMIDTHHERARATGARIVNSCGFDSIPSDLGTWAVQQEFFAHHGVYADEVTALYGETSGSFSGGTVASGMQIATEADHDREVRKLLANPHALDPDPGAIRDPVRDEAGIRWNRDLRMFTIPFFMAGHNTRIVRRGHALAGFPWGRDFRYREVMSTPGSPRGLAMAVGFTGGLAALAFAMKRPWLRDQLAKRAPQPGEGPTPEQRARGHWKVRFVGRRDNLMVRYEAADRADPGYGSTAKMLGESALCLARDPLQSAGGVLTPSVAMGQHLLDRLRRAGLTFEAAG
jgi:short subunit dehydrogenase-like uncharacterized protein